MGCKSDIAAEEEWERQNNIKISMDNMKKRLEAKTNFVEAMLCAALTWMEKCKIYTNFIYEYDQIESNIKPEEIKKWFENHKKEDLLRKQQEKKNSIESIEKDIKKQEAALIELRAKLKKLKLDVKESEKTTS